MNINLIIFIAIVCLILFITVAKAIINKKLLLEYALSWGVFIIFLSLFLLISVIVPDFVTKISNFLGFEILSNMILFLGMALLLFVVFILSIITSKQKKQIVSLAQKIALLEKKMNDDK